MVIYVNQMCVVMKQAEVEDLFDIFEHACIESILSIGVVGIEKKMYLACFFSPIRAALHSAVIATYLC